MTFKTYRLLTIIILLILLICMGYFKLKHLADIDTCLDKGGKWNDERNGCEYIDNNITFNTRILTNFGFAGGKDSKASTLINPKSFYFKEYTFVTGYTENNSTARIDLYYNNMKIFYDTATDCFCDTIMTANLNNDGVPDFLLSYKYEDGAELYGLISKSNTSFLLRRLFDEWTDTYCIEGFDTLVHIQPLQIKDINKDGKDDLIANLVKINGQLLSISCTDTVLAN